MDRFTDHMSPDVFWLGNPAYMDAWADLTGDETMTEAAYTKPGINYPGYINAQRNDLGEFVLTVRGDPKDDLCGATVQLVMPEDEFHQFVVSAQRLQTPTIKQIDNMEDDEPLELGAELEIADETYAAKIDDGADDRHGATAGDPLAQRADTDGDGGDAAAGKPNT